MDFGEFAPGKNAYVSLQERKFKHVKLGFSWTGFLFGPFVPLFRRDWKWFAAYVLVLLILGNILPDGFSTIGLLLSVLFGAFYNKLYVNDLMKKGYRGVDGVTQERINQYLVEFQK